MPRGAMLTMPLSLFGIAVVGTLFWVVNPEAAVALYASDTRNNPVLLGVVAAAGQTVTLTFLFAFGHALRRRWGWFDRQCQRVAARYGAGLSHRVVALTAAGGLLGVPPVVALAALAPGLGMRATRWLPLVFALRVARFTAIAALASRIGHLW